MPVSPPDGWQWRDATDGADDSGAATTRDALADFDLVSVAGKGAASVVYEAIFKPDNYVVALKKAVPYGDDRDDERTQREIATLRRAQHAGVVALYGSFRSGVDLCLLLEYCELGAIKSVLRVLKRDSDADSEARGVPPAPDIGIAEASVAFLARDLVRALAHLHEGADAVIHRDIKPDNILLSHHHAVVTDFGIAKALVAGRYAAGRVP